MDFKVGDLVKIINENKKTFNMIGTIVGYASMVKHKNKYNTYFKVLFKINAGEEIWCYAKSDDLLHVITEDSIKGTAKKIIDKTPVTKRIITPIVDLLRDCYEQMGLKFDEDFFNKKVTNDLNERTEMEQVLINEDRILAHKAKAYDLICEKMFMASGVIEDGDDIKWIIDPDTIVSEILKVIVKDINVDRSKIVKIKKDRVSRIVKDGDSW